MNKFSPALVATLTLACASTTFATSTDLTVKGVITPSACSPFLSSGGVIDFGKIPARELNETTPTSLPVATLQLAVTCDTAALFALKIKDQQMDSSPNPDTFYGLGKTPNAENIGSYLIYLKNPLADNNPTHTLVSMDDGNSWTWEAALPVVPPGLAAFGDKSAMAPTPIAITQLVTDLIIRGKINPAQDLTLSEQVPLTGQATIDRRYL